MLNHIFKTEISGQVDSLLSGCYTLRQFLDNLTKIDKGNIKSIQEHGFQCLVEAIIKHFNWLENYKVVPTSESDFLVHGTGETIEGKRAVGCFYVEDENELLTSNKYHFTTFFSNTLQKHGIKKMWLFSNAVGIHEHTIDNFLDENVILFLREKIASKIDNNTGFWAYFKDELNKRIPKIMERKEFRDHQKEAVELCTKSPKGYVPLPTGTGKTLIEAGIIENCIKDIMIPCCVVVTPRIVLTQQVLHEVFSYLSVRKIDAQYVGLNSGKIGGEDENDWKEAMLDAGMDERDIPSTTSPRELENYYYEAKKQNLPLIIGATYHSAPRLLETDIPVYVLLLDEAHNLVDGIGRFSNDAKTDIHKIKTVKKYAFTATPAFTKSDKGTGLNNVDLFGKEIGGKSPREMIEKGEIVPPFIHRVKIDEYVIMGQKHLVLDKDNNPLINGDIDDIEKNVELIATTVITSFLEHKNIVKKNSCCPDRVGAKLLVVCRGEPSLSGLLEKSVIMKEFKGDNRDVGIYAISTASGAYLDGEFIEGPGNGFKEKFMRVLRKLPENKDAIIFHIDMIGEGIDVPGITGVMSFRDLGEIKGRQTTGRCMRLHPEDRRKLYAGEIKPQEWAKMIKPYAWIVVPCYSWEQADMNNRIIEIAREIKEELGYNPYMVSPLGSFVGQPPIPTGGQDSLTGISPEDVKIIHDIDLPEFLSRAEIEARNKFNSIIAGKTKVSKITMKKVADCLSFDLTI